MCSGCVVNCVVEASEIKESDTKKDMMLEKSRHYRDFLLGELQYLQKSMQHPVDFCLFIQSRVALIDNDTYIRYNKYRVYAR